MCAITGPSTTSSWLLAIPPELLDLLFERGKLVPGNCERPLVDRPPLEIFLPIMFVFCETDAVSTHTDTYVSLTTYNCFLVCIVFYK